MNWNSFADFAAMGGYALYVWGAFAVTALALGWEAVALIQRRRRALERLRDRAADHDALPGSAR